MLSLILYNTTYGQFYKVLRLRGSDDELRRVYRMFARYRKQGVIMKIELERKEE